MDTTEQNVVDEPVKTTTKLDRIRARRNDEEKSTIEIEGETFDFFLSMKNARIAADAGRDPIPALFRVIRRISEEAAKGIKEMSESNGYSPGRVISAIFSKFGAEARLAVETIWAIIPALDSDTLNDIVAVIWWGLIEDDEGISYADVEDLITPKSIVPIVKQIWPLMVSYQKDQVDTDAAVSGDDDGGPSGN